MHSCKILMTSFITEGNRVGELDKKKIESLHAIHKGNKNVKKKKKMPTTGTGKKFAWISFFRLTWERRASRIKNVRKLQHFIYCEPETHPFHISDGINFFMFLQ